MLLSKPRHRVDQDVETLLPFEPTDRSHDGGPGRHVERGARRGGAIRLAPERLRVDAVQDGGYPFPLCAGIHEPVRNLAGNGDDAWKPAEQPALRRIVEACLAGGLPGPAMGGRERHDPFGASQQKRQQIRLVVVPVHDIDSTIADEAAKGRPDAAIERMALVHLDVVHPQSRGELIERVGLVAPIADVTHGHPKMLRVGACRADENGLLRSAAGAADASKLENVQRTIRPTKCAARWVGFYPRTCGPVYRRTRHNFIETRRIRRGTEPLSHPMIRHSEAP